MDGHITLLLQSTASILSGVLVFAALLLLWWKSHSEWLLLALVAEGASLLCRIAFSVAPAILGSTPIMLVIWPVTGVLLAVGLFGYALTESNRSSQ